MNKDEQIYLIALTLIKGLGNVLPRHLINYFGSAAAIFEAKRGILEKVPGIGVYTASQIDISKAEALRRAESEMLFVERNKISIYAYNDSQYPKRLKECIDAPFVFYYKGNTDLDAAKIISIVGTRKITDYGRKLTESLIADLSGMLPGLVVVSGLAYGIDICAHKASLKNNLSTIGVLAHGLDRIYPAVHRSVAAEMLKQGGLLTDFVSMTNPDRENFLKRNRIIAGLADATIVIESAERGGSLVTADIAFSYAREVFSFPGRVTDACSTGCNRLIQMNKAGLISSARDLVMSLRWDADIENRPKQISIQFDQKPDHPVIRILKEKGEFQINELSLELNTPVHKLMETLFQLELEGYIKASPGGIYKLT
jgi:DNA processing protein